MDWNRLFDLGRRRHGVVCLEDAARAGISPRALAGRAGRECWTALHRGVWLLPGVAVTPLARTAAAVLACEAGVAGHASSLWLHGVLSEPPPRPHLIVPYGKRGPVGGQPVAVTRSRTLDLATAVRVRGVPATPVARGILDYSPDVSTARLRAVVIDALRTELVEHAELWEARRTYGRGRRGLTGLDQVLRDPAVRGADSGWELDVRDRVEALGLRTYPGPFPYRCRDGVIIEIDIAIPDFWVAMECDGRAFHSAPRPFQTDRLRWTQLTKEWQVVWVTWQRWRDDRAGVMADVLDAVRDADPTRPPARPAR